MSVQRDDFDTWMAERAGKITASRVSQLMARVKTGEAAGRASLRAELVEETLSGTATQNGYMSQAMQWGIDNEDAARNELGFELGETIEELRFAEHPTIARAGASPDGVILDDEDKVATTVEIKCPQAAAHLDFIDRDVLIVPRKYSDQVQWQMACTGALQALFASYRPTLPEGYRLQYCLVERDNDRIAAIEDEARRMLIEVDERLERLRSRYEHV